MGTDFRIGSWIVRPQRSCIELRGETTHVKPKSMAVLVALARANGQVASRNDLLDAVWPGAAVTDDVLTQCVTELRKAFGDSPQHPAVIETIPKMGLRLLQDVEWIDESDDQALTSKGPPGADTHRSRTSISRITRRRLALIISPLLIVALFLFTYGKWWPPAGPEPTIVVLPFVDMSQQKDQQYLANGLGEELAHRLAHLEGLQVLSPRSSAIFAPTADDPRSIARQLAGDYLLDGSIRRSADQLRVTVQLVDAERGTQLWSHAFDRPFSDILEIQDEIAWAVAKALSVELGVGPAESRIGSTSNPAAFEQVLRGDSHFDMTPAGLEKALSHYKNALELDPDYAYAWERIASFYTAIQFFADESRVIDYQRLAEDAMSKALELAPESDSVLLSASHVRFMAQDWKAAKRLYDRAIAIRERSANRLFADASMMHVHVNMLLKLGYVSEQIRLFDRVTQGRRMGGSAAQLLPQTYLSAGRIDDALTEIERTFPEPRAKPHVCHVGVSAALSLDDHALIRLWSKRVLEHGVPKGREASKVMLDLLGDRERTLGWLREAYETRPDLDDIVIVWASYYGDEELALKAMRRSMDLWFFWMPLTARARQTEEFKHIVRDAGLVDYWREYGWNDFCSPIGDGDFECH